MTADFQVSADKPLSEHTFQNEVQPGSPKIANWIPLTSFAIATTLWVPIILYFSTLNPNVRIFPITIETIGPFCMVAGVWINFHRWASGQQRVHPVITLLMAIGAPMAAREIVNGFYGRVR